MLKELPASKVQISLYIDAELKAQVQRIAKIRGTSEAATLRFILQRGADWFDGLSRDQREAM